eukprot:2477483-Ditylum_brightwellii.AAC.1
MNSLAEMLPCLRDQPDCPAEIEQANVPLNNMALCNLIMRSISSVMEDEYNCISDLIPTNPDKLVEILSKIEKKIKDVQNDEKKEDHLKGNGQHDKQSCSSKKRAQKGKYKAEAAIPREALPKKKTAKLCKLCKEYGAASHTHRTSQCKKWMADGKPNKEWGGCGKAAANINVHEDVGRNQLMAQQVEFQKSLMKNLLKLTDKKKKYKKRKSKQYYSDSNSSDLD